MRRHIATETSSAARPSLLASDVPLREVFAQFCQVLADVLRADRAFIALREGPSLRVVHLLAHGRVEEPDDAEAGEGSYCASVARTGNSIIARDATVVPLKFGADIIGVLFLQRTSAAFEQADVELARDVLAVPRRTRAPGPPGNREPGPPRAGRKRWADRHREPARVRSTADDGMAALCRCRSPARDRVRRRGLFQSVQR